MSLTVQQQCLRDLPALEARIARAKQLVKEDIGKPQEEKTETPEPSPLTKVLNQQATNDYGGDG